MSLTPSSRAMTCREVVECTTAYLEESVQVSARLSIDCHLAGCAGCRTYLKQIVLVREATALLPTDVSPSILCPTRRSFAAHETIRVCCGRFWYDAAPAR
jgi:predicted anti-sigma-YlaC factor YlaD